MILALNHPQPSSGSRIPLEFEVRKFVYFHLSMIKKIFFTLFVAGLSITVNAQEASSDFESKYNTAKQLLDEGKYGLAMQSYKSLLANSKQNELVPYAQFYLGNAAYNSGNISYAKDVFLQLTVKHPNWSKIDAAYLWLSQIGFEQSGVFKGMLYGTKISTEPYLYRSQKLIGANLTGQSLNVLQQLYQEYPSQRVVAEAYAVALSELPTNGETRNILDSLIIRFELDRTKFNSIPNSIHKNQYTIGIMLPLFIDRVEATGKYLKKSLAIDIYEGAKMAAYDTDSSLFELAVYDTKKDSAQLGVFLERGGLKEMDAILGPIYPKPVAKMISIASKEKINFLNPTSSNSNISKSSPYAFLSRASASELGAKAAAYMKTDSINKNLFIYYGTSEVDSVSAFVYKNAMEVDSFHVVSMIKIGKNNRRQVYDILTASETITDREKVSQMTKEEIDRTIQLPTIDSLLIQPDSIGHIFIASSDATVSTEAMSAIISRGDSIKIMGVGNWFESNNAGFGIMEGLGVTLAISAVDDVATIEYTELRKRYIQKHKKQPSKYFFRGYFGMKIIAESLKQYGTYFQNGYKEQGNFNALFDFANSNSNGSVKIIKLIDNRIQEIDIEEEAIILE